MCIYTVHYLFKHTLKSAEDGQVWVHRDMRALTTSRNEWSFVKYILEKQLGLHSTKKQIPSSILFAFEYNIITKTLSPNYLNHNDSVQNHAILVLHRLPFPYQVPRYVPFDVLFEKHKQEIPDEASESEAEDIQINNMQLRAKLQRYLGYTSTVGNEYTTVDLTNRPWPRIQISLLNPLRGGTSVQKDNAHLSRVCKR